MKSSNGKWLTRVAALSLSGVLPVLAAACSDDDPASPGGDDAGHALDASVDQASPDAAGDVKDAGRHVKDSGTDAKPDTGPGTCSVALDPDPAVKVRFVNLLLATNSSAPIGQGDAFALRLYANGAAVSNLALAPAGKGATSVTPYSKIPAGDITFSAQDDATDGGAAFKIAANVQTVAAGARLTIVALGRPRVAGSASSRARLLILDESKLSAPACSEVNFRFLNSDDALDNDAFTLDEGTLPAATVPRLAAADEKGFKAPLSTAAITLRTSVGAYVGPTGQAPFTIPSGVLGAGRSYFVVSTGETFRFVDDARNHGLLFIPVGDDTPARLVKRDPLVFFFHASPPGTPANLDIQSGGQPLAIHLKYAQSPTVADLPVKGATLKFVSAAEGADAGGAAVLDNQATGPLEPAGVYIAGLLGVANGAQPLQFKSWKLEPTPGFRIGSAPRVTLIHASPSAPAADVGYWSVNNDGTKGSTFTPVFTNIAYGATSALRGADYAIPSSGGSWFSAQSTGNASTNRAAFSGGLSPYWYAAVLLGDWNAADAENGLRLVFMDLPIPNPARSIALPPP